MTATTRVRHLLMLAALLLVTGCAPTVDPDDPGTTQIVCTVGMVADIVRAVVGDRADVVNIIGEGVDPHLFQPTRGDIARLQNADTIFICGLRLEGRMTDTLARLGDSGRAVFAVTEQISPDSLLAPPGYNDHHDPHVWMDVAAWSQAVGAVATAMAQTDPENAEFYAANADRYRAELTALDDYARSRIATIPPEKRILVTAHDAFNYFGRAYDIEVVGVQGISTDSEAGLQRINELIDVIVERRVPAIFVETSVADKHIRALLEGARARSAAVSIGGSLFSDAMGAPGTYEGTYIGMIDHNATTITRALGGEAPEGGLSGRLGGSPES